MITYILPLELFICYRDPFLMYIYFNVFYNCIKNEELFKHQSLTNVSFVDYFYGKIKLVFIILT